MPEGIHLMILCIAKTEGLLTAGSYWFCEPVLLLHSLLKCYVSFFESLC